MEHKKEKQAIKERGKGIQYERTDGRAQVRRGIIENEYKNTEGWERENKRSGEEQEEKKMIGNNPSHNRCS